MRESERTRKWRMGVGMGGGARGGGQWKVGVEDGSVEFRGFVRKDPNRS